jgi:hypothetical protein
MHVARLLKDDLIQLKELEMASPTVPVTAPADFNLERAGDNSRVVGNLPNRITSELLVNRS